MLHPLGWYGIPCPPQYKVTLTLYWPVQGSITRVITEMEGAHEEEWAGPPQYKVTLTLYWPVQGSITRVITEMEGAHEDEWAGPPQYKVTLTLYWPVQGSITRVITEMEAAHEDEWAGPPQYKVTLTLYWPAQGSITRVITEMEGAHEEEWAGCKGCDVTYPRRLSGSCPTHCCRPSPPSWCYPPPGTHPWSDWQTPPGRSVAVPRQSERGPLWAATCYQWLPSRPVYNQSGCVDPAG